MVLYRVRQHRLKRQVPNLLNDNGVEVEYRLWSPRQEFRYRLFGASLLQFTDDAFPVWN